ncbi:CRISPR-associated helicase Cas3' [Shimia sp. SDUM112013]|uniref:CRISPR-associated helicase Cas3' n=1 Tax=Shimia sp. SDUM112013 TaxID=3136160 RepID=UPI0032EBB3C8
MADMREFGAWGKTDKASGMTHALCHHSADVAAVFLALLSQPVWRWRAETAAGRTLTDRDVARLGALVFLHDIGKISPAFQAKGWPAGLWRGGYQSHLEAGWHWCDSLEEREDTALDGVVPDLVAWLGEEDWLSMLFAHHGRPVQQPNPTEPWLSEEPYDWHAEESRMGVMLRAWFPEAFGAGAPLPATQRFRHFFGGVLALADWVGSDQRAFPFEAQPDVGYWVRAQTRAARRLREIGLDVRGRGILALMGFTDLTGYDAPSAAQAEIGALPVTARLAVLEAETGSGKTEAALWRYANLRAAGAVDGMYFAVPTRAAAAQLHGRVNAALARVYDDPPEAVLAIPGQVVAGAARGQRLPDWSVRWDDDAGTDTPNRWAAEHATRYLAAEVAVGTVDQAMLAALMVKHAHLRGAALARSLLVIDEVHASDCYMRQVQRVLLKAHLELGGYALLMSATLGAQARAEFLGGDVPPLAEAVAAPYPAVWIQGEACARPAAGQGSGKRVHMDAVADWSGEEAADRAIAAARQGARVLVIRNTVQRAQETFEAACRLDTGLVLQVAGGPALHHSRFSAEDRVLLDKAVEGALGKRASRGRGCVVIGTQTLEQSLDIDADLLITDLCPMDVLLQRIGRLHRHEGRARPAGFEAPRCVVLHPVDGLAPLMTRAENGLGSFDKSGPISGVYVDVPGLAATLEQIGAHPVWEIPRMNRGLVEAATHPEALAALAEARGQAWTDYRTRLTGANLAQLGMAANVVLDRDAPLPRQYPSDEQAIQTRLGEAGPVYDLEAPLTGPFGRPVQRFALPAQWARGLDGTETATLEQQDTGTVLNVGDRPFHYGRCGLQKMENQ